MKKKNGSSLVEFEIFQSKKEKELLKGLVFIDLFFLSSTLCLMIVAEGIFELGIMSWSHYWILFGGNVVMLAFIIFALLRNFKVWLAKYFMAIWGPLLLIGWAYFTHTRYVKPILCSLIPLANLIGLMFFDTKVVFVSNISTTVYLGFLLWHYSSIGAPFSLYEISLIYIFLIFFLLITYFILERIKIFLNELLRKRARIEETSKILEIKVKARTQELEELTKSLDKRVKERTKELEQSREELQKRVDELEKFHKVTVGRELKMAELKKKIKELEKKPHE